MEDKRERNKYFITCAIVLLLEWAFLVTVGELLHIYQHEGLVIGRAIGLYSGTGSLFIGILFGLAFFLFVAVSFFIK